MALIRLIARIKGKHIGIEISKHPNALGIILGEKISQFIQTYTNSVTRF
jgi:hypothetical protein